MQTRYAHAYNRYSLLDQPTMSRNFYILAAVLSLFAVLSGAMSMVPSSFQPGLPANGTLWRTIALIMLLAGLAFALLGVMSHLFEQVDRRSEEARQASRRKRRGEKN
jgi:fatty acid desaturase